MASTFELKKSFYDDYEVDCIEIWDAIKRLQRDVKELQAVVRRLAKMNGLKIAKVEAT